MAEDGTEQEKQDLNKPRLSRSTRAGPNGTILRLKDIEFNRDAWVDPVSEAMSFDVVAADFDRLKETWKDSPSYKACYKVIEDTVFKQENLSISACMCLGLGSFTGVQRNVERNHHSLSQLVVFECWMDQLSKVQCRLASNARR